ncbi:hypothetical protein RvVAR031_36480 [Agrobacterium vitis]|uniref:hypothetical protein n=1 Tax=Agrobacterium vitis TaxID=373 RepID=UPI0015DB8348|nr:hypothetical protein [Agrobacterium vitis]BCH56038.1 hypothetical protein RvVAR031_36480 [Agrobacterium vitis]
MNLRTLKKLSKRAAYYLPLLGDNREQFPAKRDDSHLSYLVAERKHWDRRKVHPKYQPNNDYLTHQGAEILHWTKAGYPIVIRPPGHPRKGTIMVGATSGYFQPEWDEECAWTALRNLVFDRFTDWDKIEQENCPPGGALTRDLSTSFLILAAARELIAKERQSDG